VFQLNYKLYLLKQYFLMFLLFYSTGGKYGFAEQIIDGMCVSINSVIVNFRAKDFAASIQVFEASIFLFWWLL